MTPGPSGSLLERLRQAALARSRAGLGDGELVEAFVARRDEAAFAVLVDRHGPMVLAVCRRITGNAADAEDAFQATFLVLARKAAAVSPPGRVGGWLHGVACRTARKARAANRRRRDRERQAGAARPESGSDERELREVLDAELGRLPDHYRAAIVLCGLEEVSLAEAARRLGWPEGTVASRLSRARTLLARRLARRGLALPALLAVAAVPPSLAAAAARAAPATSDRAAGFSPAVLTLTEGVLQAMWLNRLKTAAAALVAVGLLLAAGGFWAHRALAGGRAADGLPDEAPKQGLRDTVLALDQQFWEASSKHDTETLGRLIADDYVGLGAEGTRWTRAGLLRQHAAVRTTDLKRHTEREVVRVNEQMAFLLYEASFRVLTRDGQPGGAAHQRMLSCWVRRDGGWFVVFSHVTDAPAPAVPPAPAR